MIVFSLKLLNNLRKAIAGRRFPRQLAGGVALGALLGVIPHGNLLAVFTLATILCFRINHALMGVVAIAVSLGATRLDPYSHLAGEYLLNHPTGHQLAVSAWALPVVPWTDLNNTVVLGSFVIGLLSVLPIYFTTLPLFRLLAPAETEGEDAKSTKDQPDRNNVTDQRSDLAHEASPPRRSTADPVVAGSDESIAQSNDSDPSDTDPSRVNAKHSVTLYVDAKGDVPAPRFVAQGDHGAARDDRGDTKQDPDRTSIPFDDVLAEQPQFLPLGDPNDPVHPTAMTAPEDSAASSSDPLPSNEQMVSVETRIDVIRMKDFRDESSSKLSNKTVAANDTEQPMDEALHYLLHQLRHSQERKAAG